MKKHLVIIPVYNKLPIIKKTFFSYLKNTDLKKCISYIIDDGSDSQTKKYLEDFVKTNPEIILVRNKKNIGKPKSINKIIDLNRDIGFITIIDSDVQVLIKNWNNILLKAHAVWGNKFIIGGQVDQQGFEFEKDGMFFGDMFPFWTLAGGFFSIPKSVFKKLGFFYDKIKRHEDADYCRRAATQNIRWYYTSSIQAKELPNKSISQSVEYLKIKKKEESVYKKRSENIMMTHDVYYDPFE